MPTTPIYRGGMMRPIYKKGLARKIYPEGFPRIMPNGFPRIMPLGLPTMRPDSIGTTRAEMAGFESPRRFLTEVTPDAVMSIMRIPSGFQPEAVLDMARRDDRDALNKVGAEFVRTKRETRRRTEMLSGEIWRRFRPVETRAVGRNGQWDSNFHPPLVEPGSVEDEVMPATAHIGTDPETSLASLRAYLKAHPDDFAVMRCHAVAELQARHFSVAASLMRSAYLGDQSLVDEAMDLEAMGFKPQQGDALLKLATTQAPTAGPGGWLVVAVLHQAAKQPVLASAAIRKAREAGMATSVTDFFLATLSSQNAAGKAAPGGPAYK